MSVPTIELPNDEPEILKSLLDAAVRQAGLSASKAVAHFAEKIIAAQEAAKAPAPTEDPAS